MFPRPLGEEGGGERAGTSADPPHKTGPSPCAASAPCTSEDAGDGAACGAAACEAAQRRRHQGAGEAGQPGAHRPHPQGEALQAP